MIHCDVLIVGGGPGGSTCARALTQAGLDVLVMDKQVFPRDKVCAGWITPQVVAALHIDMDDYRSRHVLQPITGFITGIGEAVNAPLRYGRIVSFGIRRCEFDHYLLERSGARLQLGTPWKSMERKGDRWIVNGEIAAALVIGAGGHFCPIARFLGADLGKDERAIYAQEIEFMLTADQARACAVAHEEPELYFCDDLKGYGWCFRKGEYLNVGLGREGNHRLAEQVQSFAEWLVRRGRVPAAAVSRFKGHAYLLYAHATRPVLGDGILTIGDAAGLAYTQSGEGIRPAIESGLLAAKVVLEARGVYTRAALQPYETQLRQRFGERHAEGLASVLPPALRVSLGRRLMRTRWFARSVVLDRWFLHAAQPPLEHHFVVSN